MNKILTQINLSVECFNIAGHNIRYMGNIAGPIWYDLGSRSDLLKAINSLRHYDEASYVIGLNIHRIHMPWGPVDIF